MYLYILASLPFSVQITPIYHYDLKDDDVSDYENLP